MKYGPKRSFARVKMAELYLQQLEKKEMPKGSTEAQQVRNIKHWLQEAEKLNKNNPYKYIIKGRLAVLLNEKVFITDKAGGLAGLKKAEKLFLKAWKMRPNEPNIKACAAAGAGAGRRAVRGRGLRH